MLPLVMTARVVLNDSEKSGATFVLLHGRTSGRMPYPINSILEVNEALLMLKVFLANDSKLEDMLSGAPFCSESRLFFNDDLLRLGF